MPSELAHAKRVRKSAYVDVESLLVPMLGACAHIKRYASRIGSENSPGHPKRCVVPKLLLASTRAPCTIPSKQFQPVLWSPNAAKARVLIELCYRSCGRSGCPRQSTSGDSIVKIPEPRGSKYTRFKVSGPQSHTLDGSGDRSPSILSTWTLSKGQVPAYSLFVT